MKIRLLGFALLCSAAFGVCADAEHERIAGERATVNAKLLEQERECATRFIVAACIVDARTDHREALKKLRQQELQLDEGRRRAAAEARGKTLADKALAQQTRASDAAPDAPRVRVRRAATHVDRAEPDAAPQLPAAKASAANHGEVEQRNQEKFEARRNEVQAHREATERRNAQRAASGPVAAPLAPGVASAPH
jgi:colicin import membrane protein